MKRCILTLLLAVSICSSLYAQNNYKYWVQFTDKNNTPYSIDNPSEYLSQRAINRRAKFGITIDSLDLPVNPAYVQAVSATGATLINPSKWMNGVTVSLTDPDVASQIAALPFVSRVDSVGIHYPQIDDYYGGGYESHTLTWNEEFSSDWYGYGYSQIRQLNGIKLHKAGFMGQGLWIGVVDGGFFNSDNLDIFQHLYDEGRVTATRNFVNPSDNNIYRYSDHGTMVLSTMAAFKPGFYVGTAPKAHFFLAVSEDSGNETIIEEYNLISAIEFFDSLGIDLVNMSLGYNRFDGDLFSYSHPQFDGQTAPSSRAADIAVAKGMLLVSSVGNDGSEIFSVPADARHILSVGSVDRDGEYSYFSTTGPTSDGRIKPDICAKGELSVPACNGLITWTSGTSFSSPVACGMTACVMQRYPTFAPDQICDSLRAWGDQADSPDNYRGYGIPNFGRSVDENHPHSSVDGPVSASLQFKLSPNPSRGQVTLFSAESQPDAVVSVYTLLGKKLYCGPVDDPATASTLSSLQQGIYLLRVISSGNSQTLRMIRQ